MSFRLILNPQSLGKTYQSGHHSLARFPAAPLVVSHLGHLGKRYQSEHHFLTRAPLAMSRPGHLGKRYQSGHHSLMIAPMQKSQSIKLPIKCL
jgi:hypothetical protein